MWIILVFSLACTSLLVNGQSEASVPNCEEKENSLAALDLAKDSLSKAKNNFPDCDEGNDTECGKKDKSLGYINVAMNLISDAKKNYPVCPLPKIDKHHLRPMDCSEILENGQNVSGIYRIWPRSRLSKQTSLHVFCDMDTDGGGWTVIQRRGNFSNPPDYFFKDWQNYKVGFGNLTEDFWIGNDNIYSISNQAQNTIRFDLEDASGNTGFAQYKTFWIEDESSNYTLHISDYSGNVGNSMTYHDNMQFSTKDRDNDMSSASCAQVWKGGWWYNSCHRANLNGIYQPGINGSSGMTWYEWGKAHISLAAVEIKLRAL